MTSKEKKGFVDSVVEKATRRGRGRPKKPREMRDTVMEDRAAHQQHYEELPVEPMELILQVLTPDEVRGFLKGSLIKYAVRAGHKPGTDDASKARVYRKWLWEYEASGEIEQFNVKE
jgi:hypothetical protein